MMMRIALAVVLMVAGGTLNAQAISGAPYIAVHGEAKQEVVPDLFPLELTLSETSKDTAATQSTIEALAVQVLAIAGRMNVIESDLTVSNLSISPEYKYDDKTEEQIFLGNEYKREIKVRFHGLDKMRDFIALLPQSKVLRIDTGSFGTSQSEILRRGLLQKAIANARATAEVMAAGVGRKLGPVHTISNQGFNMRYSASATTLDAVAVRGVALLAPGTVVLKEGRITLDQDVYIVYGLD